MMTLLCCVCGSPDWMAVSPGTATDASRFLSDAVTEIRPTDEVPTRAWCLDHWQDSWVPIPDYRPEDECEETPCQIDWIRRDAMANRVATAKVALRCEPTPVISEATDIVVWPGRPTTGTCLACSPLGRGLT
jgi:hypothetical protein